MAQGIENLADLIADAGDGRDFFARNYVTHGMEQLFREGMLRLSGKSDQAVFELSQAMGGGKTHMMIALGLLARHPDLRNEVLPAEFVGRIDFGNARIAAFNGRNDPENFIWGEIATQLGEAEAIWAFVKFHAVSLKRRTFPPNASPIMRFISFSQRCSPSRFSSK